MGVVDTFGQVLSFHEFLNLPFPLHRIIITQDSINAYLPIVHANSNLNGMRQDIFYPVELVRSDLVSWFFFKNFQTFSEVKIDINWVILIPCPAHWVLSKLPLGASKDEHFSCFPIPCQTRLIYVFFTKYDSPKISWAHFKMVRH